ncbi:hypothetical protein Pmar_PMAR028180 [Perkinsus marinus ATCC 50983]|uniref:Uncharacterized protein n=1 Tax=Perkinsus marinus (strain ATCC 50983 / TXsc) TaxID=423536 RepID=C5LB64_PERM5|nr:hypothetical protein Pmar_PMAR028180 [Perkinsus marinus ATCC 50983]EER05992.1 hypothetical protein Pmar_PMAR028180 [Perkinsus marinus ATCC 50983]|eukprot:XP_002774176.1 hypothetical protein Pmar_PMAR028180 [Perkinsus marinus ATCC 50983]
MSIVPMEWLREGVQVFSGRYCRRGGNIVRELEVKMVPTSSGKVSVHACKIAAGDEKEALSGAEVDAVDMSNLNSLREEVVDMLTKLEPRTLTSVGTRRDEAGQETRDRRTNPEGENPYAYINPPNIIRDPTTGAGGAGGLLVGPRDPMFTGGGPQNGPGSLQPRWDPMGPAGFDGEPDYDHEVPPRFNRPPPPGKGFGGPRGGGLGGFGSFGGGFM